MPQLTTNIVSFSPRKLQSLLLSAHAPASIFLSTDGRILECYGDVSDLGLPHEVEPMDRLNLHLSADDIKTIDHACAQLDGAENTPIAVQVKNTWISIERVEEHGESAGYVLSAGANRRTKLHDAVFNKIKQSSDFQAVVVLDHNLHILTYDEQGHGFLPLQPFDVGRHIQEFNLHSDDTHLIKDIERCKKRGLPTLRNFVHNGDMFERKVSFIPADDIGTPTIEIFYRDISSFVHLQSVNTRLSQANRTLIASAAGAMTCDDVLSTYQNVCSFLNDALDADHTALFLYDQTTGYFQLKAGTGWPRGIVGTTRVAKDDAGELAQALRLNHPMTLSTFVATPNAPLSMLSQDMKAVEGLLCGIGDGSNPIGVFALYYATPRCFDRTDFETLQSCADMMNLVEYKHSLRMEQQQHTQTLETFVNSLPMQLGITNEKFEFSLINRALQDLGWELDPQLPLTVEDIFGAETHKQLYADLVVNGADHCVIDTTIKIPLQGEQAFLVHGTRAMNQENTYYITAINIEDRVRFERQNKVIALELNHRVKNILALVHSIAFLSGDSAENFDSFLESFSSRIDMLSRTHSELASRNWEGGHLEAILETEISPFITLPSERICLEGPHVQVSARGMQSLALVFHEIVTNAVKYGALACTEGTIGVAWTADDTHLDIEWTEICDVRINTSPKRQGYGTTVLDATLQDQLGGLYERTLTDNGVRYAIKIPLKALRV